MAMRKGLFYGAGLLVLGLCIPWQDAHAVNGTLVYTQPIQTSTGKYVTGQIIGGASTIKIAQNGQVPQGVQIKDLVVNDTSGQSAAIDFFFFTGPTAPALNKNGAIGANPDKADFSSAIEPASMAQSCVGVISILAANYAGGASAGGIATQQQTGIAFQPSPATGAFYVVPVIRGTGTYTQPASGGALTVTYGLNWDVTQ